MEDGTCGPRPVLASWKQNAAGTMRHFFLFISGPRCFLSAPERKRDASARRFRPEVPSGSELLQLCRHKTVARAFIVVQ